MHFRENLALAQYTSMGLGGTARYFIAVTNAEELIEATEFARNNSLPVHILGEGSNTIVTDNGFAGLVIKNEIKRYDLDDNGKLIAGAGENWESVVGKTVEAGWSGIEALSLIPGTVGAAPVQNIGAYGQELSETCIELEAYDLKNSKLVCLVADDLDFAYRTSKLKKSPGRYIVTSVSLQLHRKPMQPPFYTTLQRYFDSHNITDYSPANVRKAVINWRSSYLPDVSKTKTAGSFFTNPFVEQNTLDTIIANNPDITDTDKTWYWTQPDGTIKVAAGRLAEFAGLKDWYDEATGMATWKNSALVLVNESAKSYQDLADFRKKYLEKIEDAYGITFDQEPIEL